MTEMKSALISTPAAFIAALSLTGCAAVFAYYLPWSGPSYQLVLLVGGLFSLFVFALMRALFKPQTVDESTDAKAIELHQLQAKYQAVIENAREVMFQISPAGNLLFLNPEWERFAGASIEQTLGASCMNFIHAEDRPRVQETFKSLAEGTRNTCNQMVRWQIKSGEYRWVDIYARSTLDNKNAVISIEGSFIDVTERIKAMDALQASEEKHRLLCNTTTDAILMLDKSGVIEYANPAATELFGYTAEQLVGQNISILQPERMREAHIQGMKRYIEQGLKKLNWRSTELFGLHAQGHEFPLEIAFSHAYFGDQQVFIGFIRDLSVRKQTERALRISEERYYLALKGSLAAVWDWDIAGNKVYYSLLWKEMLGYKDEEVGNTAEEFESRLHPDDREAVLKALKNHFVNYAAFESEYRLRTKDGSYRWVKARGQAIRDENGRATRMVGALMSSTQEKKSELRLESTFNN